MVSINCIPVIVSNTGELKTIHWNTKATLSFLSDSVFACPKQSIFCGVGYAVHFITIVLAEDDAKELNHLVALASEQYETLKRDLM